MALVCAYCSCADSSATQCSQTGGCSSPSAQTTRATTCCQTDACAPRHAPTTPGTRRNIFSARASVSQDRFRRYWFCAGNESYIARPGNSASTVTDGQYQFAVPPSQLTNDLDIAAGVAKSDYAAQAQLAELTAKWVQEYNQRQRETFIAS